MPKGSHRERKTPPSLPDLEPARWIWYPSERCLPNTFVLFRRELELSEPPRRATGWISADSRYLLQVNGQRMQWGPAPCDPRWLEADPIDLTAVLDGGKNVLAVTALYFGHGDGTWAIGKAGFLFRLEIENSDGTIETIVSDESWHAHLARSWPPGQYKRWFVRALQEEFDARLYPTGWQGSDFTTDKDWLPSMVVDCPPNKPTVCSNVVDDLYTMLSDPQGSHMRSRTIPMLDEVEVPISKLSESYWIEWQRPPVEYFECKTPDAFHVDRSPAATAMDGHSWSIECDGTRAAALNFELEDAVVGWPHFTIEAPEGTVVELLVHEAHEIGGPALLNTHFNSWTRFTCVEGVNHFETFDFESCRWIQLHIHNVKGTVKVSNIGMRRRIYPWPHSPEIHISEPALQRLMDASVNTLHNSAQETLVDGMARERQQYSGDGAHQMHGVYFAFGESDLLARYLITFSQGSTLDGYFLDTWPAYDRLSRMWQRQMDLTIWGPLLDHGVGLNFDCFHYYMYTGDHTALEEPYPRLLRHAEYLESIIKSDGLLPVEDIGAPTVWLDHNAYTIWRHRECAFNLYTAAMMEHALAPICRLFGDEERANHFTERARGLHAKTVERFWSDEHGTFIVNRPWLEEEGGGVRMCDRSLATAILFDQCPKGQTKAAVEALATVPPEMGLSYPANAGWRLWALAKAGRIDVVLDDLRKRWAPMDSVIYNKTLQEAWDATTDSGEQWSHCAIVPLYILYMSIVGIRPLEPGFGRCEIRPQLGDLGELHCVANTVRGGIVFDSKGKVGDRTITISMPAGCEGELVIREEESVKLEPLSDQVIDGHRRYRLAAGETSSFRLQEPAQD